MKGKTKLTMKQKKFADALIKTNNKTKAAQIAYPNASYHTCRDIGSKNTAKPDIIAYLKDNCDIASSFMV
jgi:phage terminase small subunit